MIQYLEGIRAESRVELILPLRLRARQYVEIRISLARSQNIFDHEGPIAAMQRKRKAEAHTASAQLHLNLVQHRRTED
jgi:hypothetical protein